jgi:hypothetical protein
MTFCFRQVVDKRPKIYQGLYRPLGVSERVKPKLAMHFHLKHSLFSEKDPAHSTLLFNFYYRPVSYQWYYPQVSTLLSRPILEHNNPRLFIHRPAALSAVSLSWLGRI